jgi:ribokinase
MLLVFGSINADLLFQVPALPRPGETVLCPGYAVAPGGKGANQAAAAAKAGARVRLAGHVGGDGFGLVVRRSLGEAGVDCGGIGISPRPTGVAVIGVDPRGENQIIVASGANLDTRPDHVADAELGPGVTVPG